MEDTIIMKDEIKKCIISRYDETIKRPPFLTIPIDKIDVPKPKNDKGGAEFAERLKAACRSKGYVFKFYTYCNEEGMDYELVVY